MKDVHTEHCCAENGCKYGEEESCPVWLGYKPQSYPFWDGLFEHAMPNISEEIFIRRREEAGIYEHEKMDNFGLRPAEELRKHFEQSEESRIGKTKAKVAHAINEHKNSGRALYITQLVKYDDVRVIKKWLEDSGYKAEYSSSQKDGKCFLVSW